MFIIKNNFDRGKCDKQQESFKFLCSCEPTDVSTDVSTDTSVDPINTENASPVVQEELEERDLFLKQNIANEITVNRRISRHVRNEEDDDVVLSMSCHGIGNFEFNNISANERRINVVNPTINNIRFNQNKKCNRKRKKDLDKSEGDGTDSVSSTSSTTGDPPISNSSDILTNSESTLPSEIEQIGISFMKITDSLSNLIYESNAYFMNKVDDPNNIIQILANGVRNIYSLFNDITLAVHV